VIWSIPECETCIDFAKNIGCDWIGEILVSPDASCDYDVCHNNVKNYILSHNGNSIKGYYFLESPWGLQAILHSVWQSPEGRLIDITPFKDNRNINIFGRLKSSDQIYKTNNIYSQSLDKYKQETDIMFYVYALIDPRNNMPFYIGKGKGRRAKTHLWEIPETRNVFKENKINSIRAAGLEPKIEYLAEDIIDEKLAYKMEEDLILRFGRKGYETYGILTNILLDSRPPNHKGKTYEEIYGTDRAQEEKRKRADLQKARGGYGPKKHSDETKTKIKDASSGENNAMWGRKHSEETRQKISKNKKSPTGKDHPISKHWILESPNGEIYEQIGDLKSLCKKLGLSFSTLHMAHLRNRIPNRGPAKGWKITTKLGEKNDYTLY
jgi:hypothetical protein